MLREKWTNNFINNLYYFYFVVLSSIKFIPNVSEEVELFIALFAICAWVLKYIKTSYDTREHICNLILLTIGVISVFTANKEGLLLTIMSLIGLKDVCVDKLIKYYLIVCGSIMIVAIVTYVLNSPIESVEPLKRTFMGYEFHAMKNPLCYHNPNYLYLLLFLLFAAYIYIEYERLNYVKIILALSVMIGGFIITFSRTGIVVVFISVFLICLSKSTFINNKLIYTIIRKIPIISVVVSFLLPYLFKYHHSTFIDGINKSLQYRVSLSVKFIEYFGVNILGQNVHDFSGNEGVKIVADNSYVNMLCSYGVLVFILFLFATYKITTIKLMNRDIILINIFYIYCFAEANFSLVFFNLAYVCFYTLLYKADIKDIGSANEGVCDEINKKIQ